ncbi:chromosomal replication initiator protein DnaA [Candidatus Saccharibacteria bacterium]|nr:chromosomal replication initiator protein DnaA [Candidatus Saccharibacteria bacterium]
MSTKLETVWGSVLGELEIVLSQANFQTWLKGTELAELEGDKAVIFVPNIFTRQWIQDKYHQQILSAIRKVDTEIRSVEYTTKKLSTDTPPESDSSISLPLERASKKYSSPSQYSLESYGEFRPNQKYKFDNFITGSSNKLAFSAAQLVSEKPGEMYNPLFLYGPAGVGKTHLLWAISNEIHARQPNCKILYSTSEEFINTFLSAIRRGEKFTDKYRKVDVLLVDDMQFLAGKEKTQEEFFHTFNALHQYNKQIVLCSDRPPKEIPTLEARLRSRFEWGMVADIQPPDFETRVAILMNKAASHSIELSMDVAEFIATHIDNNIRELEGALTKVIAYSRLHGQSVDLPLAQEVLGMYISKSQVKISPKVVLQKTADYYEISYNDIVGTKRSREIVLPRQVAMFIMREELSLSFPRIAKSLGGKDHTTIMHGVNKIRTLSARDSVLGHDIQSIKKLLVTQ